MLKLKSFIIILLFLFIPVVNAKTILKEDYKTKNFIETLEDEELGKEFSSYSEGSNKITIYLFRGKGCGYCRAFLSFMNSITNEYGKYFNLISFETWYNSKNYELFNRVAYYLDKELPQGVPYIIIGDKVFDGYSGSYDESIKKAIIDLYNTSKDKRFDVFEEIEKNGLITIEELKALYSNQEEEVKEVKNYSNTSTSSEYIDNSSTIMLFIISTVTIMLFDYSLYKKLYLKIEKI